MRHNLTFFCALCVLVIGGDPPAIIAEGNSNARDESHPNGEKKHVKDAIRKLFAEYAPAADQPHRMDVDCGVDDLKRILSHWLAAEA